MKLTTEERQLILSDLRPAIQRYADARVALTTATRDEAEARGRVNGLIEQLAQDAKSA